VGRDHGTQPRLRPTDRNMVNAHFIFKQLLRGQFLFFHPFFPGLSLRDV
jgi:hypothetical protein